MSGQKSKKTTSAPRMTGTNGGSLPQFVSCELTDDEKSTVRNNLFSCEEVIDFLEELQSEGYRVAISHDVRSDCVGLYVTATDPDHENHGLALSARGPTLIGAITVIAFKHHNKLGENWRTGSPSGSRDIWG